MFIYYLLFSIAIGELTYFRSSKTYSEYSYYKYSRLAIALAAAFLWPILVLSGLIFFVLYGFNKARGFYHDGI